MKRRNHRTEHGFSLLESSIALGITASVMLLAATVVRYSIHLTSQYLRHYQGRNAAEKTFAILEAALRLSEHHRFPFGVTIDSSPPSVLRSLPLTSRARPESHILSIVHVSLPHRSSVVRSTIRPSQKSVTLEACQRWSSTGRADIRSYLLVGLTHVVHLVGTKVPHDDRCFILTGRMISPDGTNLPPSLGSPLEVLPVVSTYTFFIDTTGQLRLVSHVGGRILENQPIQSGIRSLTIKPLTTPDGAIGYEIAVRPSLMKPLYYTTILGITKRSLLTEVLL